MKKIEWSAFQDALKFSDPNCKVFVVNLKKPSKWWQFWRWGKVYQDQRTARAIENMLNWVIRQPDMMKEVFKTMENGG